MVGQLDHTNFIDTDEFPNIESKQDENIVTQEIVFALQIAKKDIPSNVEPTDILFNNSLASIKRLQELILVIINQKFINKGLIHASTDLKNDLKIYLWRYNQDVSQYSQIKDQVDISKALHSFISPENNQQIKDNFELEIIIKSKRRLTDSEIKSKQNEIEKSGNEEEEK